MRNVTFLMGLIGLLMASLATPSFAASVGKPLPALSISQPGEIMIEGDDISYQPWDSENKVEQVHVVQYVPATMSDSKMYRPFTNYLQEHYDHTRFHVTTVIDLDAALWGTSGLVSSEVEKSKRQYPLSTLVLDKTGSGIDTWSLGKDGSGLFIIDQTGIVQFVIRHKMSDEEQQAAVDVFSSLMEE
ncbi:MAG: YtfJ family protein [Halioglobus sp.]